MGNISGCFEEEKPAKLEKLNTEFYNNLSELPKENYLANQIIVPKIRAFPFEL